MALGFFVSWIQRCIDDPDEDVTFDVVIYFYASCWQDQGHQGWAVPALAYCMFYSWNIVWSFLCLFFLLTVMQCWVRLSCSMLALGAMAICFMDVISVTHTWINREVMYTSYPINYRTHRVWENMFLQLIFLFGQLFLYCNSIWDAWFRNNADVTTRLTKPVDAK